MESLPPPSPTNPSPWRWSRSSYNILVVSLAFMVLFCAYNPLQSAITSLFAAGLGNQSLGILYASVAVTVFFGPPMVNSLGARATMVIGAACYVAYMATLCITVTPWVVLCMSVVIGFGAAVLWVAVGVYIAQNSSKSNYGRNTGVFWAIFQLCNIFGNLGMYLVFSKNQSAKSLYVSFTIIGAVGTAMLLLLRKASTPRDSGLAPAQGGGDDDDAPLEVRVRGLAQAASVSWGERVAEFARSVLATFRVLFSVDGLLLTPMYFFSGLELSFWTGEFTLLLRDASVIGLVLTLAGVGEVLGGLAFGRLSDRLGRSASLIIGTALYGVALGLTCWMKQQGADGGGVQLADAPLVAYAAALAFGLADSCFNTSCYALCAEIYSTERGGSGTDGEEGESGASLLLKPTAVISELDDGGEGEEAGVAGGGGASGERNESAQGFTVFQLAQNIGSATWYYVSLQLPLHDPDPSSGRVGSYAQVWIQVALMLLGTAAFVAVDWKHIAARRDKQAAPL